MAKKIVGSFKLQVKSGEATMAPPVGPAFGQRGLNGMEFVKQFNAQTAKAGTPGQVTPVIVTYYADKTFTFIIKSPPAAVLLRQITKIPKGSPEPNRNKVGTVTQAQIDEVVKIKMKDLNCESTESAISMIKGTARSMGLVVEG